MSPVINNGVNLVTNTKFDATTRNTLDLDATYLFSAGGRHELKGGYQYNGIGNKVDAKTTEQIVLRYRSNDRFLFKLDHSFRARCDRSGTADHFPNTG